MWRDLPPIWPALCLMLIAPSLASAHALGANCKLKDGKVLVEVYYDDDSPATNAKVQIVNSRDEIVACGITNEEGRWSFAVPAPGKYEAHVDAGAGHRAKTGLTVPARPANLEEKSAMPEKTISDGPSRADFTGTPWLKLLVGLGSIGGLCGAFLVASKLRKKNADGNANSI